jgi:DNA replication protein DnaC
MLSTTLVDDLSYGRRDQAETSVLFELIAERYERKSIAITANAPFSAWDGVFPDKAMTVAAVDRLVHHVGTATELSGHCPKVQNQRLRSSQNPANNATYRDPKTTPSTRRH